MRLTLLPFSLPLRQPLVTAHGSVDRRDGLLVGLSDGQSIGWGEVCPLPGWSPHDLAACGRQLQPLVAEMDQDPAPALAALLAELDPVPAARAGLAGAAADLAARRAGVPLATHLADQAADRVRVNATIADADPEQAVVRARAAVAAGIEVLKVKVAFRPLDQDLALLRGLRQEFGSGVELRLDANGGWDPAQAVTALDRLAEVEPVYCEEPTAGIEAIAAVGRSTTVPVAIDESASTMEDIDRALALAPLAAVVIKPQAIGGPDRAQAAVKAVVGAGARPIVTTIIDGAVGVAHAVHLAAALGGDQAHGVATSELLASDVGPALPISHGSILIPDRPGLGLLPFGSGG